MIAAVNMRLIYRNELSAARGTLRRSQAQVGRFAMLDIVMLALGLGFFVAAIGYTYACERL